MREETAVNPEPKSKEIRICLVMYGGVSLAIYMNGIAREFYDLVRGRGMWGVLKRLADVDVTVDVLAGASAGGINSLFLSYALCNDTEFGPLARLWRDKAGFGGLLQDPDTKDVRSLLKSDYMERSLEDAFREMATQGVWEKAKEELDANRPTELDCLLAVTDYHGDIKEIGDFRKSPIQLKSYKEALHLTYRRDRKNAFRELDADILAKMARATSAFPVAFEPVVIEGRYLKGRLIANCEYVWDESTPRVFIDGGVLDNAPFGLALPIIYQRHSDRPVDRVLFYVEPDPVLPDSAAGRRQPTASQPDIPNFVSVGISSLSSIPSHQTISEDLRAIEEHNRKIDLLGLLLGGDSYPGLPSKKEKCPEPPAKQKRAYLRARLSRMIETISKDFPHRSFESIRDEIMEDFQTRGQKTGDEKPDFLEHFFENHQEASDNTTWILTGGQSEPNRFDLSQLDLTYVKRAHYYWIYRLHDELAAQVEQARSEPQADQTERVDRLRRIISHLSRRVDILSYLETILYWCLLSLTRSWEDETHPKLSSSSPLEDRILAFLIQKDKASGLDFRQRSRFQQLLMVWSECLTVHTDRLSNIVERDPQQAVLLSEPGATKASTTSFREAYENMWEEPSDWNQVSEQAGALLPRFIEPLNQAVKSVNPTPDPEAHFRCIDAWRYPAMLLANLGEMDKIDYYRICPVDSATVRDGYDRLNDWAARPMTKLGGTKLAHFGAFLRRPWRSNDIMWGRLDASSIVWDVLFVRKNKRLGVDRARELINQESFKFLDSEFQEAIRQFADGGQEDLLRRQLLHRHQEMILEQELRAVLADAVDEEYDLTQARSLRPSKPLPAKEAETTPTAAFCSARSRFLRRFGAFWMGGDQAGGIKKFFQAGEYDLGNEPIEEIGRLPLSVLTLHALRVLTNMTKNLSSNQVLAPLLNRVSIGLTTTHVAAELIQTGTLPLMWLTLVATAIALVALYAVSPVEWRGNSVPFLILPVLALLALTGTTLWLSTRRWVRIATGSVLAICFLGAAAAISWFHAYRQLPNWFVPGAVGVLCGISAMLVLAFVLKLRKLLAK